MVWRWGEREFSNIGGSIGVGLAGTVKGGWIWGFGESSGCYRWHVCVAVCVTAMVGVALAATIVMSSHRGSLKSPWSRRKRKHVLTPQQWKGMFTLEGKLCDGGVKLLKKVRSGGVDPSIRSEVWPFLLGVYDLSSSEEDRNAVRKLKRKEYKKLRKRCQCLLNLCNDGGKILKEIDEIIQTNSPSFSESQSSTPPKDVDYEGQSFSQELHSPDHSNEVLILNEGFSISKLSDNIGHGNKITDPSSPFEVTLQSSQSSVKDDESGLTCADGLQEENEIKQACQKNLMDDAQSFYEEIGSSMATTMQESIEAGTPYTKTCSLKWTVSKSTQRLEDFTSWQRTIRLDAVRANAEWMVYAPAQASISEKRALELADAVCLKDYDHLDPHMIHHAARLVAILEAYAVYDPDIGYCQGMSDLLSPIISVMEDDDEAFWCFVGFMMKARHNFRLDEIGIRRQLSIVSKIIKFKDPHLYKHLVKLQAEDCFFVYRMVVVLFRRELTFEQTVCLWEVMWADQTTIRSGFGKSAWAKIRLRAPPTDDLLLYAIAACVLQRRKLIIERYSSMEEILRECNNMAGHLDVWKLLDDAHDLVVNLHEKIS